jgi:hypothetical protein
MTKFKPAAPNEDVLDGRLFLVRIPCDDGREYDMLVIPPRGWSAKKAVKVVETCVRSYFASSGEHELVGQLADRGFTFPAIYDSKESW